MFYFPYKILQAMLLFLFSLSSFDYQGSNIPATDPWPPLTFSPVECTSFPVKNITSSNDGRTDNY